jgi:hypothetical protein
MMTCIYPIKRVAADKLLHNWHDLPSVLLSTNFIQINLIEHCLIALHRKSQIWTQILL